MFSDRFLTDICIWQFFDRILIIFDCFLTHFCNWQFSDRLLTEIWQISKSLGTNIEQEYPIIMFFVKRIFSAYSGCLVASLTLPNRPPFINTFQELLNQKDITIVGSQNSFMDYLNQTSDSVLMVLWLISILISKELIFNVFRNWTTECCSKATMKLTYQSQNIKHLHTKSYLAQPLLSACKS